MDIQAYQEEALRIRELYGKLETQKVGRRWTNEETFIGLTGDVGDLSRLILLKEGAMKVEDPEDLQQKLGHEISDCLWAVLILAKNYHIDLETAFFKNMKGLEERIRKEF